MRCLIYLAFEIAFKRVVIQKSTWERSELMVAVYQNVTLTLIRERHREMRWYASPVKAPSAAKRSGASIRTDR